MNQLEKYREELMACNEKILEGLLQRNAVVEELMAYKEENKMPMLQPNRKSGSASGWKNRWKVIDTNRKWRRSFRQS